MCSQKTKKGKYHRCQVRQLEHLKAKECTETWLLTSSINKVGLSLRGRRRQQLVIELVGAEGAWVVPPASVHDGVGHHDVAQRVVQVAVQQAALVLGRRHVVLREWGGFGSRSEPHWTHTYGHTHHGGALLLDDTLVHEFVESLRTTLCPLRVFTICNNNKV